jgi:hypothetical protein
MMDTHPTTDFFPAPKGSLTRPIVVLLVLLVIAVGVRVWLMDHSATISKDGVGYVAMARAMEVDGGEAIQTHPRHPGYPSVILMTHSALRAMGVVDDSVEGWDRAGRWASIGASVGVLVGLWVLASMAFDRRVAWITVLLSLFARKWASAGADVLADPLCVMLQVWAGVAALGAMVCYRDRPVRGWVLVILTGVGAAGAYYVRPEGGQIVIAAFVCWLVCAGWRDRRWGWALMAGGVAVGVTLLLAWPYMAAIGGFTCRKLHLAAPGRASLETGLLATQFHGSVLWSGFATFSGQLTEAMHPILAGLGLAWLAVFAGSRWGQHPALADLAGRAPRRAPTVLVATSVLIMAGLTIPQYFAVGMLSHRYLLFCAVALSPLAAAGVVMIARLICRIGQRLRWPVVPWLALAIVVVIPVGCLAGHCLQSLHGNRAFLREAGEFIATQAQPGDVILTDQGLVAHYADLPSVPLPRNAQLTPRRMFTSLTAHDVRPTFLAVVNVPLRTGHYNTPDLHAALDADARFERLGTFTRDDEKEEIAVYRIVTPQRD